MRDPPRRGVTCRPDVVARRPSPRACVAERNLDRERRRAPNRQMRKIPGWVMLFLLAALVPAPFWLAESWWARALLAVPLWGYSVMLLGIFMASRPRRSIGTPSPPQSST